MQAERQTFSKEERLKSRKLINNLFLLTIWENTKEGWFLIPISTIFKSFGAMSSITNPIQKTLVNL